MPAEMLSFLLFFTELLLFEFISEDLVLELVPFIHYKFMKHTKIVFALLISFYSGRNGFIKFYQDWCGHWYVCAIFILSNLNIKIPRVTKHSNFGK